MNIDFIESITDELGLSKPTFHRSSKFGITGSGTEKLVDLLETIGVTEYISGPGAEEYLDISQFDTAGIELYWHAYDHPEYDQLYGEFTSHLSIVDLMFNEGADARSLIRDGESDALVRDV